MKCFKSVEKLFFLSFSINNKLQNPEAANGVLMYAERNSKVDYVSEIKRNQVHL